MDILVFHSIDWTIRLLFQIHFVELESKRTNLVSLVFPTSYSPLTPPKAVQQIQIDFTVKLMGRQHSCDPIQSPSVGL
jgi:hypothetical protein